MDSRSGICVFRRQNAPCLVAYRLLHTRYLIVIYTNSLASIHTACFSELLDFIPVCSHRGSLSLPLANSLDDTLTLWRGAILRYLSSDNDDAGVGD